MGNKVLPLDNQISFLEAILTNRWAVNLTSAVVLENIVESLKRLKEIEKC